MSELIFEQKRDNSALARQSVSIVDQMMHASVQSANTARGAVRNYLALPAEVRAERERIVSVDIEHRKAAILEEFSQPIEYEEVLMEYADGTPILDKDGNLQYKRVARTNLMDQVLQRIVNL